MLKIFKNLKVKDWVYALISLVFISCQVYLDLKLPDYMSEITQLVQTEGHEMSEVLTAGGYMLLCALGSMACAMITGYFVARIAAGLSMTLRDKVYHKVMDFSMEEIGNFSTASLITRSTNDITQIQMLVAMGLQAIVKAPIMAVWAIAKISIKNWEWTAVTAGAVAILLVMLVIIFVLVIPRFTKIQKLTDNLNRVTRENLTGVRVVRAYNAEDYQENKFKEANDELTNTNLFTQRVMAFMSPMMSLIMSGLTLAIYWVGVYLIDAAEMMDRITIFSDMVVLSSYAMQVIMAFMLLTMTMIILPRASVSAKRINEVLDTDTKIIDGELTATDPNIRGEVEFKNVSFKYPDAEDYVLHDVSFTAHKGETVAFIGSTGSGKSTLINLVPRFYDVTEGEILVDGVDIRQYEQKTLRDKIGYISQRATLFTGTVTSNVAFGENDPDPEKVAKAVDMAQAAEFVEKMPNTYEASISQGGTNVSGGQKQRLSIARAIYKA